MARNRRAFIFKPGCVPRLVEAPIARGEFQGKECGVRKQDGREL